MPSAVDALPTRALTVANASERTVGPIGEQSGGQATEAGEGIEEWASRLSAKVEARSEKLEEVREPI